MKPTYCYRAHVCSVHDGDTIRADIDLGFKISIINTSLRLAGIDAPELRGSEKERGVDARNALAARIAGRDIVVETDRDKAGKYGRYFATVWLNGENINKWMIDNGYATAY